MGLARELTLFDLISIGVGSVVGSGIFILFASILSKGKKSTLLALLLAAIPNVVMAFAYAELAGRYQKDDLEYQCVRDAYNETTASISTYILVVFMIFNAATALIFIGHILSINEHFRFYAVLSILFILSFVNYLGINVSKSITNTIGTVEITLLILISLFAVHLWQPSLIVKRPEVGLQYSFWTASFLGLFLYSGYDAVVKLSEETIKPEKNIPLGIIGTIVIVTIIYLLLTLTACSMPNMKGIYSSNTPITEIFGRLFGHKYSFIATVIGIAIVVNTFFISIISLSRFSYSLGNNGKLPSFLSVLNDKFKTPHNAIIFLFLVLALVLLIDSGEKCAMYANIFFLFFMMLIMSIAIILRLKKGGDGDNKGGSRHHSSY